MKRYRQSLGMITLFSCISLPIATASFGTTAPQDKALACTPQSGQSLVNFGHEWTAWSDGERSIYLEGFIDGQGHTFFLFWNVVSPARRAALRLQSFTFYDRNAIRDVMSSLYSDPANTYITFDAMVYIARDKLSGKDIEMNLRHARQEECAFADTTR